MGIDFEAEGLLEGLGDAAARRSRLQLLRDLSAEGVGLDELKRATAEDRLALLPLERVLESEGPRYTPAEVAERAGIDERFLTQLRGALGLPRADDAERALTDDDVEAARAVKRFRDAGLPDEGLLEIARAMGSGLAQISATSVRVFGQAFLQAGDTERDLAVRQAGAARQLAPQTAPLLEYVLRMHQLQQTRQAVIGRAELTSGRLPGSREIAACFADLVGFTRLGERLPVEELGAVAGRLSELAAGVVSEKVRLVKMIGDAAMLVSTETDPLIDAALALVAAADEEGEDYPQLRAGLAAGEALGHAGDWYGSPVNRASRVTSIARPGSVLCAKEVRQAAAGEYRWSNAGRRRVKGIKGEVSLFRVRHPPEEPDGETEANGRPRDP